MIFGNYSAHTARHGCTGWPLNVLTRHSNKQALCLCIVARYERIVKNVSAPSCVRKHPEIFWRTLLMRSACSARLLVKGTPASVMKRQTSSRYWRSRLSRLCALLCLCLPCLPRGAPCGLT